MDIKVEIFEGSSFPVVIEANGLRTYVNLNDAIELRNQLNNIINAFIPPKPMKLEKVITNHGIHIRGPYKDGTAYIGRFYPTKQCERIVDWIIKNYPHNKSAKELDKYTKDQNGNVCEKCGSKEPVLHCEHCGHNWPLN